MVADYTQRVKTYESDKEAISKEAKGYENVGMNLDTFRKFGIAVIFPRYLFCFLQ